MQEKYRELRESKGLTAQVAATSLEVSIATLLSWESGKSQPKARQLLALCELYGCTCDELLGRS